VQGGGAKVETEKVEDKKKGHLRNVAAGEISNCI